MALRTLSMLTKALGRTNNGFGPNKLQNTEYVDNDVDVDDVDDDEEGAGAYFF